VVSRRSEIRIIPEETMRNSSDVTPATARDRDLSRRAFLKRGGAGLTMLSVLGSPALMSAFRLRPGEQVIPWADRRPDNPMPDVIRNQQEWEDLDSWITPNERFFGISRYEHVPKIDAADWRLSVGGRVRKPMTLALPDIRARRREEVTATIECAGTHGLPFLDAGIGNARWGGTPLAALLEEAGIEDDGVDVVFFGADRGEEEVHGVTIEENFARSMSIDDAMQAGALLTYEMNGEDLPARNGFPLRLVVPGWYGMASVKWLERIEVHSSRFMGRFQADQYVTLRAEPRNGDTLWTRNAIRENRLKSVPGRVAHADGAYRVMGAAWGAPIERVEVRIDDGGWREAELDRRRTAKHAWIFWTLDWDDASRGEHTITSRAIDVDGNVQPALDDPVIANKHTYWESNGQVTRRIVIG
jgi:DMSO/TMAO reductase YedYZ molybdopterin-dependent catalytic subunit